MSRVSSPAAIAAVLALSTLRSASARAEDPVALVAAHAPGGGTDVSVYAGAGLLGGPGSYGTDVALGVRVQPLSHLAVSLDLGYGLVTGSQLAQDRWWAIPSVALVIPIGQLSLDLGGGLGVGTSSGYRSWSAYVAGPFDPTWHRTVPAAQLQAVLAAPVSPRVNVFALANGGSLIGVSMAAADTTWFGVGFGVQDELL